MMSNGEGEHTCEENWPSPRLRQAYTVFIFLVTYLLPLGGLSVTYTIVAVQLWRRSVPGVAHRERDNRQLKTKRKALISLCIACTVRTSFSQHPQIVKMLVLIVTLFAICWLPLHFFFILSDFTTTFPTLPKYVLSAVFIVCHWLSMSNSFVNPIIYGFMNESFRIDLLQLIYRLTPCLSCTRDKLANNRPRSFANNYTLHQVTRTGGKITSSASFNIQSSSISNPRLLPSRNSNVTCNSSSQKRPTPGIVDDCPLLGAAFVKPVSLDKTNNSYKIIEYISQV